ncbi:MAG: YHS domain-containing protein [Deferribacteraceae bacterium]|jgi:YHS domain-containing protein|nr:YHS domain-containing protein [Deferribacteraceae bacterium]
MPKYIILIVSFLIMFFLVKNKLFPTEKKGEKAKEAINATEMSKDPVCGTYVEEGSKYRLKYYGKIYYFCSHDCMIKFKEAKSVEI